MEKDLRTAIQDANTFYIHYNKMNIGSRTNGRKFTGENFKDQKSCITAQLKNHYVSLFKNSLSNEAIETLSKSVDLTEDKFWTQLNRDLKEELQKELNVQKLQELHNIFYNSNFSALLKGSITLDKNKNITENVTKLSEALKIIEQALKLIEDDPAVGAVTSDKTNNKDIKLGNILSNSTRGATSFIQIGEKLESLLKKYKIAANYEKIKKQSLEDAVSKLQGLAYALKNKKMKSSGNPLSANGLSKLLLNNLVSTSIAEPLMIKMEQTSNKLIHESMVEAVGSKPVQSDWREGNSLITRKTDVSIKTPNVNLNIKGLNEAIRLTIGISSKFYTNQQFNSNLEKVKDNNNKISSGSGGTLKQALFNVWNKPEDRYLALNYFTHQEYQLEIKDLILTRQIIRLFSSAGQEDFASFILINGCLISVLDLMQYSINAGLFTKKDRDVISLSISKKKDIHNENIAYIGDETPNTAAAWQRSRNVNSKFNASKIYAELHLQKLITGLSKG